MTHEEILKRAASLGKRISKDGVPNDKEWMSYIGKLGGIASAKSRRKKMNKSN